MGMTSGASGGVTSDINVTPMADVMLVLLIIFMITAPLLQEGIYVNKAKARNAQEAPDVEGKDSTIVTITRAGEIFVNSELIPPADLIDRLLHSRHWRSPISPDSRSDSLSTSLFKFWWTGPARPTDWAFSASETLFQSSNALLGRNLKHF